jgi:hypothetical protein
MTFGFKYGDFHIVGQEMQNGKILVRDYYHGEEQGLCVCADTEEAIEYAEQLRRSIEDASFERPGRWERVYVN